MVADGMLTRKRYREVPPRVDYELTDRAKELMPVLAELARWGYEWAWSAPRASESVDLGAIFRLAPGLVQPDSADGTVEFTVSDGKQGGPASYSFSLSPNSVTITERAADGAEATVTGDRSDWIRAFSPERDRAGLKIAGERRLAELLLDGLALSSSHRAGRSAANAA
jgi:hypothetical protein